MTTYLGKSCSFCLPRVPFVNCRQFMYLVISLLVLRAGYGIWLYQFLIIAYLFTFHVQYTILCFSLSYIYNCTSVFPWNLCSHRIKYGETNSIHVSQRKKLQKDPISLSHCKAVTLMRHRTSQAKQPYTKEEVLNGNRVQHRVSKL